MDLRQLRYFVAVAEDLNFSRAAERLNVSQPPVSMQIKALEDELGARLFNRTRRKVEITQAGLLLLDSARKVLGDLRRATEAVGRAASGEAGLIRMGFTGSVPMLDMFPRLMRAFRDQYPDIRVELSHISTARQLEAIGSGDLDVGILRPPYHFRAAPGIVVHPIWRDELMVFLPASHRFGATEDPLSLRNLKMEPFVGVAPDIGCGMYDHVMTICSQAGFAPKVVQDARELGSVLALVAAGIGVAILPRCYDRIGIPGVVSRKLAEPGADSELILAFKTETLTPQLQRFIDVALLVEVSETARGCSGWNAVPRTG